MDPAEGIKLVLNGIKIGFVALGVIALFFVALEVRAEMRKPPCTVCGGSGKSGLAKICKHCDGSGKEPERREG